VGVSEAVDAALCYGWISGQSRPLDDDSWLGWFCPRRPGSIWSKLNTERTERLIKEGKMKPAGLREIEDAKRDGRWGRAYPPPSRAKVPRYFLNALKKNPRAQARFRTLNRTAVYAIVWRLETARSDELRTKKVAQIVEMLEKGEKFL